MNKQEIQALQERLRQLLLEDIGSAFRAMREALPDGSPKENIAYNLEAQFHDLERDRLRGILSTEALQLGYSQVRAALLDLIASLEERDFQTQSFGATLPVNKTGSLLYKIPEQMQLGRESRCIVRLAFEEESVLRHLEPTEELNLQSIRISEVMEVALLDPNPEATFAIRAMSTAEQFVERGDYSEWLFFVQPLREGVFPLLLKIAVVEVVQGRERRKEIVLEETVRILTTAPAEESTGFKSSGYAFNAGPQLPPMVAPAAPPAPSPGGAFQPGPFPSPQPFVEQARRSVDVQPKPKRSALRRMAPLATVLILLTVSLFWLLPNMQHSYTGDEISPTVTPAPDSLDIPPGTPLEGGSWQLMAFYTTDPARQRIQDSLLAVLQPLIYHFEEGDQLRVQNAFGLENGRYYQSKENQLLLQGKSWKASGEIRYQTADSLVLYLTYTYTRDSFPLEVRLRRLP